ncbi:MAG TPA: multiheme c-type cytochrome [Blastocatellia bacterium]|nr:multiheme c-type cytochrome [Blastocatellia bacterium]
MSHRKRIVSVAIICVFALAIAVFNLSAGFANAIQQQKKKSPPKTPTDREALAKKPAPSGSLKDRLGADDGYGLALFYSSTVHGNLEVCGCPIHPLGGVARRTGYINAFKRRSPDAAILQVDAGFIFGDETNSAGELREDIRLMNDWIVRANEVLGLDVVNLGFRDLRYAGMLLNSSLSWTGKPKAEKSALISSNVKPVDSSRVSPAPYVIKIATAKRLPQPVRIAFIGVSDVAPEEQAAAVKASGLVINDPLESVKAALAEVRDRADVTVVVGFLSLPMVNKLARQNDDLDIIINTDERGLVPDPRQINNALVVYAAKETKHLGELRFYVDKEGVVDRFTARYIELDEVIPDDPQLLAITKQARKEIDVVQNRLAEEEAKAFVAANGSQPSAYVTSEACAKCHKPEYETWQKSRHSRAFAALETKQRTYDAACIGCHSLGFQKPGGFVNIKATQHLANVQCESCHGPGAEHVAKPTIANYKTPPKNESCLICHDRENSPDFDFAKYWPVVAHANSLKQPTAAAGKPKPVAPRRVRKN